MRLDLRTAIRRRLLLVGPLAVLVAAFLVAAPSARSQDGWIGELALDNALQKTGVSYGSSHVTVVTASCTGLRSFGFRPNPVNQLLIEFHRFRCQLEGADKRTYMATVRITERTGTRFSWEVTSIKQGAVPSASGGPVITGSAATSGGTWVYFVTGYHFSCPGPPAGFRAASYNPIVQGPAPLVGSAEDQQRFADRVLIIDQGSDQMTVGCTYFAPSGRSVILFAAFALPNVNTNPYATFDFGCGQNMVRIGGPREYGSYYVASPTRWAYATFTDYYHALQSTQLPVFASVARTLLQNVLGAASTCSLDTTVPIAVGAAWTFSFSFFISGPQVSASISAKGAFTSYGGPDARNDYKIRSYYIGYPGATLTETRDGVARTISLSITEPTFYYHSPDAALTLKATVTDSNDPSCPTGSTGTITFHTSGMYGVAFAPTTGKLTLCGLAGKGMTQHVTAGISTGGEAGLGG